MPVYHTVTFPTDADSAKFFSTPVGTLNTPACLTREVVDGVSCLSILLGEQEPDVIFAGAGGGTAHADMQAALGAWPDGTEAHCHAVNSAQHGDWVKTSGVWVRQGPLAPKYEFDNNHMNVLENYNLIVQSCFNTGHPAIASDGAGAFVDKVAFPNVGDMTNHIVRYTIRCQNFRFPTDLRMAPHLQGQLAGVPRIGTGNSGAGAFPLVNAMNHADFMGALGSGSSSIFADNIVNYIADSGFVTVDAVYAPSSKHWTMMCGNADKDAHEGAAYDENVHYIGTTPERLVSADVQKVNSYLGLFRWNRTPGVPGSNSPRPRVLPDFEPTGKLLISKIEFIAP